MDFNLSEDHKLIKDTIARFMRDEYGFEKRLKIVEEGKGSDDATWAQLAELGLVAAVLPESAGGLGGTGLDIAVVMEEFGRGILAEPYLATAVLGAGILADIGGHDALLDGVIAGETKLAFAHYEPSARYNPKRIDTNAGKDGTGYVLTGEKSVVWHGGEADYLIISAVADSDIGLFLVPADADGMTVRDYPTQDGARAAEISLDDVTLGEGALLASGDAAQKAIDLAIDRAMLAVGAEALGAMEAARDMTLDYLKTRKQFGLEIGKFQALQHRMVDLCLEIEQVRSLVTLAAVKFDEPGLERDKALAAMKVKVGQGGRLVSEESIQLHGGIGMTWEYALGHLAKRLTMIDHSFGDSDYHLKRFVKLKRAA